MITTILAIVAVIVLVVVWASFNALRSAEQGVRRDFNNITTELERRSALIPNLVKTVKQYAAHEHSLFDTVTKARANLRASLQDPAHATQAAQAHDALSAAVGGLFAVAENYPALRASENFLALQGALTDTEDRIAASRKLYNMSVEHLNTTIRIFPSNLVVGLAGVTQAGYFTVPVRRLDDLNRGVDVKDHFA